MNATSGVSTAAETSCACPKDHVSDLTNFAEHVMLQYYLALHKLALCYLELDRDSHGSPAPQFVASLCECSTWPCLRSALISAGGLPTSSGFSLRLTDDNI